MAKKERATLPASRDALAVLGAQIGASRRELGWTAEQLAQRLGTSRALVTRIERGAPTTAIGTVLDAAVICGVRLFGVDEGALPRIVEVERARVALLPAAVRARTSAIDDDF